MRTLEVTAEPNNNLYLHMPGCEMSDPETGLEASFTTTMGVSGLDLLLRVSLNGETVREKIDLRPLAEAWVTQIADEMARRERLDTAEVSEG